MTTVTITWKAFADSLSLRERVTSATLDYDFGDKAGEQVCDVVFADTNRYQGEFWNALEPHLPENRTHTSLSMGDEVEVDGVTYLCDHIGWEIVPKTYRVSVWASVDVTATSKDEAESIARDLHVGGEIKNRDYEFTAEAV